MCGGGTIMWGPRKLPFSWRGKHLVGNPYGRSAPQYNLRHIAIIYTLLHITTHNYMAKALKEQRARLEKRLSKELLTDTRDTLSSILGNEEKKKKTSLPFPIAEIQVHLLDEDGEGMVLWLQGSIEKGKTHIEKGFEELTDMESIQVDLLDDEEEHELDPMIEEIFTTTNKKPVLLN